MKYTKSRVLRGCLIPQFYIIFV